MPIILVAARAIKNHVGSHRHPIRRHGQFGDNRFGTAQALDDRFNLIRDVPPRIAEGDAW